MYVRDRRFRGGFTLLEMVLVVAILAIMTAIAVPNLARYQVKQEMLGLNDKARMIYLAAQNGLSALEQKGALAGFAANAQPVGDLPEDARPEDWDVNRDNLVYYALTRGAFDDEELRTLLDPYIQDKPLLDETLLVEFNRLTGRVSAVLYSERADRFAYEGSNNSYNGVVTIADRTKAALERRRVGYYGSATTGEASYTLDAPEVRLENGLELRLVWSSSEARLNTRAEAGRDIAYAASLLSSDGKTTYLTLPALTREDVTTGGTFGMQGGEAYYYKRLQWTDAGGNPIYATVYYFSSLAGGDRFEWVLDAIDDPDRSAAAGSLSLYAQYPQVPVGAVMGRVEAQAPMSRSALGVSQADHSYFAGAQRDGTLQIANPRHLYNLRYHRADAAYVQTGDVDWSQAAAYHGGRFVPLTAFVARDDEGVATGVGASAAFSGNYDGKGHAILNLDIEQSTPMGGLFAQLGWGAQAHDLTLQQAHVVAGSRSGILAGQMLGDARVANCTVEESAITGVGAQTTMVGGLVGELNREGFERPERPSVEASVVRKSQVALGGEAQPALGVAGGLAGSSQGALVDSRVEESSVTAYVSGNEAVLGGLVGQQEGWVSGCVSQETYVAGNASVMGGFLGKTGFLSSLGKERGDNQVVDSRAVSTTVAYASKSGAQRAPYALGGFAGLITNGQWVSSNAALERCYASNARVLADITRGSFDRSHVSIGGFLGELQSGVVRNCYANAAFLHNDGAYESPIALTGSVGRLSGKQCVGGLVGWYDKQPTPRTSQLQACYSNVLLPEAWVDAYEAGQTDVFVGGVYGDKTGAVTAQNCYYLAQPGYNDRVVQEDDGALDYASMTGDMAGKYAGFDRDVWQAATATNTHPDTLTGPYAFLKLRGQDHWQDWPVLEAAILRHGLQYYETIGGQTAYYNLDEAVNRVTGLPHAGAVQDEGYCYLFSSLPEGQIKFSLTLDGHTYTLHKVGNEDWKWQGGGIPSWLRSLTPQAVPGALNPDTGAQDYRLTFSPEALEALSPDGRAVRFTLESAGSTMEDVMFNPSFGAAIRKVEGFALGTDGDPYEVRSPRQLCNLGLSQALGQSFAQTLDVNYKTYGGGNFLHQPIGIGTQPFTGHFDGGGYAIWHFSLSGFDLETAGDVALFGYADGGALLEHMTMRGSMMVNGEGHVAVVAARLGDAATLRDTTVDAGNESSRITSNYAGNLSEVAVGVLAAVNQGSVQNCTVQCDSRDGIAVSAQLDEHGRTSVGGLIGNNVGEVQNCAVRNIYVVSARPNQGVGGLVGRNTGDILTSQTAFCRVSGHTYVGGLVGWNTSRVEKSLVSGAQVKGDSSVGGLAGRNDGVLRNDYVNGFAADGNGNFEAAVQGTSRVGGLVGDHYGLLMGCYSNAKVEGESQVGGAYTSSSPSSRVSQTYYLYGEQYNDNLSDAALARDYAALTATTTVADLGLDAGIWEMNLGGGQSEPEGYPYPKLKGQTHPGAWPALQPVQPAGGSLEYWETVGGVTRYYAQDALDTLPQDAAVQEEGYSLSLTGLKPGRSYTLLLGDQRFPLQYDAQQQTWVWQKQTTPAYLPQSVTKVSSNQFRVIFTSQMLQQMPDFDASSGGNNRCMAIALFETSAGKPQQVELFNPHFAAAIHTSAASGDGWPDLGSERQPFQVRSPRHLANLGMARYVAEGYRFEQTTLLDYAAYQGGGFLHTPIGEADVNGSMFQGVYEGNGLAIRRLRLQETREGAALFMGIKGSSAQKTRLSNVVLEEPNVEFDTNGYNAYYVAPLVGQSFNTGVNGILIEGCSVRGGSVVGDGNEYMTYVGGLVAYNNNAEITRCLSTCTVTGNRASAVGGLIAYNTAYEAQVTFCYANNGQGETAGVRGATSYAGIGGFVGHNGGGTMENCYALSDVHGVAEAYVGGFVGNGSASYAYAAGKITPITGDGFLGNPNGGSAEYGYYLQGSGYNDAKPAYPPAQGGTALSYEQMQNFASYAGFAFGGASPAWETATATTTHAGTPGAVYPFPKLAGLDCYGAWPAAVPAVRTPRQAAQLPAVPTHQAAAPAGQPTSSPAAPPSTPTAPTPIPVTPTPTPTAPPSTPAAPTPQREVEP